MKDTMRKIGLILLLLLPMVGWAQIDTQQIDADTAKVGTTGKSRIAIIGGMMYFRGNTGTKRELLSTNNTYTNPSWLSIDKTKVGLPNVNNTSDANKPVSTATQTALDLKLTLQISATYAAIGGSTSVRLILVLVDESNSGERTLYFHDGTNLNWIITQKIN